mgnify:CR=1 FL=1
MYKVIWDKKTGGVVLTNDCTDDALSVSPRPVFFEELDLLGLDKMGWKYPRCQEPLLWACNKQYYYRGDLVFEAKGANLYDKAEIVFQPGFENLKLQAVDVKKMLAQSEEILFLVENEAIEFIRDTFQTYSATKLIREKAAANQLDFEALKAKVEKTQKRKMAIVKEDCESFDIVPLEVANAEGKKVLQTTAKIDVFLASFSGGKDSQVVLDLCTRALPPSTFQVIYSDTGYELPPSLKLYEEVKKHYGEKYPGLLFRTARNHESVLNYWDKIGTPSDTHRWCCSIMKTAPLYRMLKIEGTNKQARVLAFDGVRAEESVRRSSYARIGKGKHTNVINAHPIVEWNTTEIFMYLLAHNLTINPAYRCGKARVGCIICPFSTTWDDMIVNKSYPEELQPFTERIIQWSKEYGVRDSENYLRDRKWKLKATGKPSILTTKVEFPARGCGFSADVKNAKHPIYTWLRALGNFTVNSKEDVDFGELRFAGKIYSFEVHHSNSHKDYSFHISSAIDPKLGYLLRRVITKSAYCIQCEVCEVDCPHGALSIYPKLEINNNCKHCHKCLELHDRGCIASDCIRMIEDTNKKVGAKVNGYKTFGLHDEWLSEFFADPESFWKDNSLGTAQVDSCKSWLKDADIINLKYQLTPFGEYIKEIFIDDEYLAWELIWINLSYNSFIVNWFVNNIRVGQQYDKKLISSLIREQVSTASAKTIDNAVAALFQLFKNTPIGYDFCMFEEFDSMYVRAAYDGVNEKTIAYALYRYAESKGIKTLRVSDMYSDNNDNTPVKLFGICKESFNKAIQTLNSANNRVLIGELNMGLDHITLREDLDSSVILRNI